MKNPGVRIKVIQEKILSEKGVIIQQLLSADSSTRKIKLHLSFIKDKTLYNLSNKKNNLCLLFTYKSIEVDKI